MRKTTVNRGAALAASVTMGIGAAAGVSACGDDERGGVRIEEGGTGTGGTGTGRARTDGTGTGAATGRRAPTETSAPRTGRTPTAP